MVADTEPVRGLGVRLTGQGRVLIPSLGLEGAFTVGWGAAKVVCALAGKKRDYLKDEVVSV